MPTPRLSPPLLALLLAAACADDEAQSGSPRDGFDAGSDLPIGVVRTDRDAKAEAPRDGGELAAPRDAAGPDAAPRDAEPAGPPHDASALLDAHAAADTGPMALDARPLDDARSAELDATSPRDTAVPDGCSAACGAPDGAADDCSEPSGFALFEEHFEQDNFMNGEYHGFLLRDPSARVSIDPGTAARPTRSLRIAAPLSADAGTSVLSLERGLASLVPRYVSYRVKLSASAPSGSASVQFGSAPPAPALAVLTMSGDDLRAAGSNIRQPFEEETWLLVQLRDIDWTAHRYDLYVDCRRVARNVPFDDGVDTLDRLGFVNDGVTSYYDDIVIK